MDYFYIFDGSKIQLIAQYLLAGIGTLAYGTEIVARYCPSWKYCRAIDYCQLCLQQVCGSGLVLIHSPSGHNQITKRLIHKRFGHWQTDRFNVVSIETNIFF